jgi:hypothetical protein
MTRGLRTYNYDARGYYYPLRRRRRRKEEDGMGAASLLITGGTIWTGTLMSGGALTLAPCRGHAADDLSR